MERTENLNREQYKKWLLNAASEGIDPYTIELGSVCKIGCRFCFNNNDFPGSLMRIPFITRDEFEDALDFVNPFKCPEIIIGGGFGMYWNEPMAHPDFIYFLKRINERYPDVTIHFDTSAVYATDEMIEELKKIHNLKICLSVNTFDSDFRNQIMSINNVERMKNFLSEIPVSFSYLKYFGDTALLCKDVETLKSYKNKGNMCIYKIHYTKYSSQFGKEFAIKCQETHYDALEKVYQLYEDDFYNEIQYMDNETDMKSVLYKEHCDVIDHSIGLLKTRYDDFTVVSTKSTDSYFRRKHPDIKTICVENRGYGGSITSAGLLVFRDIREYFEGNEYEKGATYIIPSDMMNDRGYDKTGDYFCDFRKQMKDLYSVNFAVNESTEYVF